MRIVHILVLYASSLFLCFADGLLPEQQRESGKAENYAKRRMSACQSHELDFIMIEGDENLKSIEDDIRTHLAAVGFNVKTRLLTKEDFNKAHQNGDFHLSFSETWGAPYDPHAYASGWVAGDEGHYHALSNLVPPLSREGLFDMIEQVLKEENDLARQDQWKEILTSVHAQAVMVPLWGKRIPTIINNERLTGYEPGLQQFDYPVHRLSVISGSSTVTIAPGAQTGAFQTVGRLDPHSYRPNEFFANNWVYEGLVSYGPQGQTLPALAVSWSIEDTSDGGQMYTFALRPNVTFHDGAAWNCAAATLNFDHVFAEPLRSADYHGWYHLIEQVDTWGCGSDSSNNLEFFIKIKSKYYPFLQELTFIRPLRMLSPMAFMGSRSPTESNSCPVNWGTVVSSTSGNNVTCAGIANISGTGPFMFSSRIVSDDLSTEGADLIDDQVVFVRNDKYWGGQPSIERLVVQRYDDAAAVKAAILDQSLDVVWGAGVLQSQDLKELATSSFLSLYHSEDIQNTLILLNSGKPPLNNVALRKTIIHAIDKVAIIEKEFGGFEFPVSNIFPMDAPYCDLFLSPRWDYDIEKSRLLNCNPQESLNTTIMATNNENEEDTSRRLALGLGLGLGGACAVLLGVAIIWYNRGTKAERELQEFLRKNPEAIDA